MVMTMTRKGVAPIKLWFDNPEEMTVLSNKRNALNDIFKLMDTNINFMYNSMGRIDTMELFGPILISIQGKFETILHNMMLIFGFGNENDFSRDEFHFFLDCLFRGLNKLLIPQKHKKPLNPGRKVLSVDIEALVSQIFPSNIDIIDRADFVEFMLPNKEAY